MDKREKIAYISLGVLVQYFLFKPVTYIGKGLLFLLGVGTGVGLCKIAPVVMEMLKNI